VTHLGLSRGPNRRSEIERAPWRGLVETDLAGVGHPHAVEAAELLVLEQPAKLDPLLADIPEVALAVVAHGSGTVEDVRGARCDAAAFALRLSHKPRASPSDRS
jgi:hypothetical protein